jgi:predicted amidohydrolase
LIVAAFQFAPEPEDTERNWAIVERGLREAAARGARVVGLPEMWPTSFAFGEASRALARTNAVLARLRQVSKELRLVVVGSALGDSGQAKPLNLGHVLDSGDIVLSYAKVHLFTPTREERAFTAGSKKPSVVETSAGRISIVVCYDLRFPELCRTAFLGEADLVIVPAQWAAERFSQWRALVAGRAVENQCVYLGVNRTGKEATPGGGEVEFPGRSLVADGHGRFVAEGGAEDEVILADVDLTQHRALRRLIPCKRDRRPDVYTRD